MKHILTLLFVLLTISGLYAQNSEIDSLVMTGIELHDAGDYNDALAVYEEALALDPNSTLVLYEMAYSLVAIEDYVGAEELCKKVIKLDGDNVMEAYIVYGTALDMQGKTKQSIKVYKKAMKKYDYYLLSYNCAISCRNADKTKDALTYCLQAIEWNVGHASSHILLSELMIEEGKRVQAMLPLYLFLLLEPDSWRSATEYEDLISYWKYGIEWTSDTNVNVQFMYTDDEFTSVDLSISLSNVLNSGPDAEQKTDMQLFVENTEMLFSSLADMSDVGKTGVWWEVYIPFYNAVLESGHLEAFCYLISQSQGEEVSLWMEDHEDEMLRLEEWFNE